MSSHHCLALGSHSDYVANLPPHTCIVIGCGFVVSMVGWLVILGVDLRTISNWQGSSNIETLVIDTAAAHLVTYSSC